MDSKHKEPTANMKAALLDLLNVVRTYDAGKAGLPHDVNGIHHMTLKAMAKPEYGKLILLDASYGDSPTRLIWTVAITRYGLKVAKQIEKQKSGHYCTDINDTPDEKKKPRSLRTIQWQVDVNQKTGEKIYKDAKAMKKDRSQSFTKTMNLLVQLHDELKAGQVALLQKLYPEAYANLLLIARNEIEMDSNGELRGLIDEFKRHIQNAPQTTFKPVSSVSLDDDDTTLLNVQKDATAGLRASQNFLRSIGALNPAPVQAGNPKQIIVAALPMPVFDDED